MDELRLDSDSRTANFTEWLKYVTLISDQEASSHKLTSAGIIFLN